MAGSFMNGHSREVIEYLREPLPDEEEWPNMFQPIHDICGNSFSDCECGEHCEFEEE